MTTEMLEFMKLYDKMDHDIYGKFKLSHLEIGKLLKCWIATDKYGNTYYRNLTTCIREHLVLDKDYIIERKTKNQQGQRTWFVTKEAFIILAMLLTGGRKYRADLLCNERIQIDQRDYFHQAVAQANASGSQY